MSKLEEQKFFKNLSYSSKNIGKSLINANSSIKKISNFTTYLIVIIFLISLIFLKKFSEDSFLILLILLIILLLCTFMYKPLESFNKNFKTLKEKMISQIDNPNFCKCSDKCDCRDEFIKFMKEKKGIKLY